MVYGNYEKWKARLFYLLLLHCGDITSHFLLKDIKLINSIELEDALGQQ